jgi:NTP pyrophosphatase (non-canonical NTP hydrolase)
MNLNDLRDAVYADAVAHGLWEDAVLHGLWEDAEYFAKELEFDEDVTPEAREFAKKFSKWYEAAKLIYFESEEMLTAVEEYNYDNAIEELADTIIMCLSAAGYLGIDIDAAVRRKMEINKARPWKHGKNN